MLNAQERRLEHGSYLDDDLMKSIVFLRWSSESSKFWREEASRREDQVVRNKVVTLATAKTDLKRSVKVSVARQIHGERQEKRSLCSGKLEPVKLERKDMRFVAMMKMLRSGLTCHEKTLMFNGLSWPKT